MATVTVSTNSGIDLRFNPTLYNQFANSPINAGGSTTQFIATHTGTYNGGPDLPIKFVVAGTGLTYSGAYPNIQLTGGTITSFTQQDDSSNVLATYTGYSISATAFQAAMNTYTSGNSSDVSGLQTLFRQIPYTITGGGGADTLQGGFFADIIAGGSGNDFFVSTSGDDSLDGGSGSDIASYVLVGATGPITVTMGATSTVVGDASIGTDTLVSIERVRGTEFADVFTHTSAFSGNFGNFAEFEGMGGNDTMNGTGTNGNTRAVYTNATAGVFVDLGAGGTARSLVADAAGIGVDTLNGVTGVSGSAFADTLTAAGGIGQFQFFGLGGNDTIIGTAHGDTLTDFNIARYDQTILTTGVVVSLGATSTVTGDVNVGTDTLVNIESVRGTQFVDSFTASAGFSAEFGSFNSFEGLGSNDTVTGNGFTRIEFGNALAAVTINLATQTAFGTAPGDVAGVGTDSFTGVNSASGSAFDDTLIGSNSALAERFRGQRGNDNMNGGGGVLDNVDYRSAPTGVNVNLAAGTATDGFGGTDTLSNIEGARGSEFNDIMTGDGNSNQLVGNGGDDVINGAGGDDILIGDSGDPWGGVFGPGLTSGFGNDTLNGGAGDDTLDGGIGIDTAVFAGPRSAYTITRSGTTLTVSGPDGTDTLTKVETLVFDDLTLTSQADFAQPTAELAQFGAGFGAGGWTSNDLYPRELADVNGDGLADIAAFGFGGVSVSLARDFLLI